MVTAAAGISSPLSRLTKKPSMLNHDKVNEMKVLRWVMSGERFRLLFHDMTPTPLDVGIEHSLKWYSQRGWL
jgi:hypothetical protein